MLSLDLITGYAAWALTNDIDLKLHCGTVQKVKHLLWHTVSHCQQVVTVTYKVQLVQLDAAGYRLDAA